METPSLESVRSSLGEYLLQHGAHPVLVMDESGRVVSTNRAAASFTGIDLTQLVEDSAAAQPSVTAFRAELRAKGTARAELRLPAGWGVRHLALQGTSVGRFTVVTVTELTEQRALEEELTHLRRVESIGFLTASIVHDFNNLLTPILCLGEMMGRETREGSRAAGFAKEITTAAERAAGLVRQVLAFVRRGSAPAEPVDLRDVLMEMRSLLERLLGEDVELVLEFEDEVGNTRVDREQLEHVILNLVANARDAMPRGGQITLQVASAVLSHPDGVRDGETTTQLDPFVVLNVVDTGVGIAPEVRPRIFERFFTTKDLGHGTGLGLAAVHRFVTRSGGRIAVESSPGQGTIVSVYLPQAEGDGSHSSPPATGKSDPGGSETVLVVEGDELLRGTMRAVLEDLGYRVLVATSGEEAVRLGRDHAGGVDLLLFDSHLGGVDGHTIADTLATYARRPRVLFTAAYPRDFGPRRLGPAQHPVLMKAFSVDELASRVRQVLEASQGDGAPMSDAE